MSEHDRRVARLDARSHTMSTSLPVTALTGLGILIVVLGLFVAGSIELILVGLGAIAVAGVLQVAGTRRS
jgi:hypothetical protein